ncbi:transporter substrate-binding domain-containing protein [Pseudomonas sp. QE6]|uniref:transglycosylase SLT domain-containing protein n=1 Tax=Pseudomonas sp. QE6 TaxID=3242491 RepID=UPI003529A836
MLRKLQLQPHPSVHRATPWRPSLAGLATLLWALSVGALAAADAPEPSAPPQAETFTLDPNEIQKPWTGDLDGMIQRKTIRVLTIYSKTFYFTDMGVQRGVTYEWFTLFEQELNKQLASAASGAARHLKVHVVFVPVRRDQLIPALIAGQGDIAASNLTTTAARREQVDFSVPGYSNVSEVILSGPASPQVATLDDLSGKDVFVRKSSSYYESLLALNQRFATEGRAPVNIKPAPEALEDEDLVEMLNSGLIPLIVMDKHKADLWKQVFPGVTVHDAIVLRMGGEIAWALRKNSPQLKAAVDDFVMRHREGSLAGNLILMRYLKNAKYIEDVASESERRKFLKLVQFFRQYGDKYSVDWLLMAAQGYQESRLDQSVRSPVGAIGVMQVMPATGKELKVGDIRKTRANIEAGTKYMRLMIDRYYGDEPMTDLDKALFTFASYNAGPARVTRLREEAARRGLDPNVWFHNVEYVTADQIGAETVTYVSNIYKYYIAYRLILDARAAKQRATEQVTAQPEQGGAAPEADSGVR